MKVSLIILTALVTHSTHAQQYGWQVIARPTTRALSTVDFVDTAHGWCAGRDTIYRTTDGGLTWRGSSRPFGANAWNSISFSDMVNGWAVGRRITDDGLIWRTTDRGNNWSQQYYEPNRDLNGTVTFNTNKNLTAGSTHYAPDTGLVVRTTNAGTSWQEQRFGANMPLGKVVFVDSLDGWIVPVPRVTPNPLLRTNDAGATWQQLPTTRNFASIEFLDTLHGWAAAYEHPSFYRTTDGGTTWDSLFRLPDDYSTEDLSFADSLYGWAFGNAFYQGRITEAIYHTTNGGQSWYRESIGLTDDLGNLPDAIMLDRTHGWAVAGDGRVLAYRLVTSVVEKLDLIPRGFSLRSNYPNPFNPGTTIEYELPERRDVVVKVFDALGREVQTLVNALQEAGVYRIRFDGSQLASGTYFYRIQAADFQETKQMTLVK